MPGTSRHHWGTELDFISSKLNYWNSAEGKRTYQWLNKNAQQYGFYQPYTADPKRSGYAEERWHWSYKSIATRYLAAYQQKITAEDLCGFYGSYLVDSLHIIQTHVMGVAM
jgi:LAS superfamily LD-carboxypeptidase LdcB